MNNVNINKIFGKNTILFSILFSSFSYGNYAEHEYDSTYGIIDISDERKINNIRKKLIENSNYTSPINHADHIILNELNVSPNFIHNPIFKKELARQKKMKPIIMKNLMSKKKRDIISHINNVLNDDEKITNFMIFLAMNESNFNQYALSDAKARGIWQFMPDTARDYDLRVNNNVDERINVNKSTKAAIKYLKNMNKFFKSWKLSIMAYNTGPGNVTRAFVYNSILNKCKSLGSACNIDESIKNDSNTLLRYDLYKSKKNYKKLKEVFKKYQGSDYEPSLSELLEMKKKKKQYLPKETRNYIRRILASSIIYKESLLNIGIDNMKKNSFETYKVKNGDTLSKIANMFNTDYKTIMRNNNLQSSEIKINQKLKIY